MATLEWPNRISPGIRPFRLAAPDGWSVVEIPGALIALLGPDVDGFRSNLVVSGCRLPTSVELGEVADSSLDHCDPHSIVGPVLDRAANRTQLAVAVRRGVASAGPVRLVQLAVVTRVQDASPAGLCTVFTLLGTCPVERAGTDEALLIDAIASFATGPSEPHTDLPEEGRGAAHRT
jgi:hypothetical protein